MSRPAFFFDRDGVVNRDPDPKPYVLSWEQWEWMPGLWELIQAARERGMATVLVTSQKGVGKGLMSHETLEGIHGRMQEELGDLAFDAIHAYTALPDCAFKAKPDPQMIFAARDKLDLDLATSWLIGDADRDIAMARAAGVGHTIRVRGVKSIGIGADYTVDSLAEALERFEAAAPKP